MAKRKAEEASSAPAAKKAKTGGDANVDMRPKPQESAPEVVAYWKQRLNVVPQLALPADYEAAVDAGQIIYSEQALPFPDSLNKAVLQASLSTDKRPFTLVLAAFSILLHKYSREENIVVGSSSSDFNPLALRVEVTGDAKLGQFLDHVHQTEEDAERNAIPFDALMDELKSSEAHSHTSNLFSVAFFNAVDVNARTLEASTCDWTVYLEQLADAKRILPLKLRVLYNTLKYSEERMSEMLLQVSQIVSDIAKRPDLTIQQVSLLTDTAKANLPDPAAPLDPSWMGSVMSKMTENASKHPDRIGVVEGDVTHTYKSLEEKANRIANYLVDNGMEKGDVACLYAHRSSTLVIAIMGILKAGATFTVIDPAYPVARQNIYLSVAKPRAILQLAKAGALNAEVQAYADKELQLRCQLTDLDIDTVDTMLAKHKNTPPAVEVGPDDIGTLSFTSGSTGIPKGVRGRHVSLTHFYPWMKERFGLSEHSRFSMLSGIAHDPIQRDVFTPMYLGASIHIPSEEDIGTPGRLSEWMAKSGVTVTHLTPAMGQLLNSNATAKMPNLTAAFFVGDILTKRDVRRLQALAPNVTVINMYGTTETQRAVSYLAIPNDGSIDKRREVLPAGQGMKDVQLLVLTPENKLAGIGELGDLCLRSPHLSWGYLGLPDKTAEKFVTNPFTGDPKDRMYLTGDLGRFLPDGTVECIGRADDQVKIRGFRVELGEIDTFLGNYPDVKECLTMVRRDAREEKIIIAYFVPKVPGEYDLDAMRTYLRQKLPSYAVPSVLAPLTRMPLTPNGKIDRNKLPFPDAVLMAQQASMRDMDTSDATPLEKSLLALWKEVLGRPVGLNDNFFDVGGHSILATRLTFQMRQTHKQELPLNMLYENPTIRGIATAMSRAAFDPGYEVSGGSRENVEEVDLEKEVVLDETITAAGRPFEFQKEPRAVFLTGATGFLGAFLLSSLLRKFPKTVVHCLVRGKDAAAAKTRLRTNLENTMNWDASFEGRTEVVVGDLGKARFGLSEKDFEALAEAVDAVYHNGALVHWVYPYSKLKDANVGGTVEALRLASLHHVKPVHFVSSTSVFDSQHYNDYVGPVPETDDLTEGGKGLTVGYGQSKWVSERILMLARDRGIPITIFRPGYVVGHSKMGVMNIDDYLVRLLKGCVELGSVPVIRNRVNMCPVDFVANAIVHISSAEKNFGKFYHISNPNVFRFNDYFGLLQKYGYKVEAKDYMTWRDELMALTMKTNDNALYPLLHFVLDDLPTRSRSAELDTTQLFASLKGSGIECESMFDVMGLYLAYLNRCGYLDAPTGEGEPLPELNIAVAAASGRSLQ